MASTLYARRNEPDWGERKVYMRKNPNPNHPNPAAAETTTSSSNPNPNPNRNPPSPSPGGGGLSFPPGAGCRHRGESLSGGYVTFHISAYSRSELRDLKRRLTSELDRVRGLASWIESRSGGPGSPDVAPAQVDRDATSSSASRPPAPRQQPPPPDPPPHKKPPGSASSKRPPPPSSTPSPRDAKRPAPGPDLLMKKCGQILTKLMRHKHGWVFNEPVDAVAMGLHDYNIIVKRPMDLGTVKSRLETGAYPNPLDFGSDVRLTFNNALLYNPKGHDVYIMAEQLLRLFEDLFAPAKDKYEKQRRAIARDREMERQKNHHHHRQIPPAEPSNRNPNPPGPSPRMLPPAARPEAPPAARPTAMPPQPQQIQMPTAAKPQGLAKQPKPKARDPHKREMSFREKQKLSQDLQAIPDEKMDQIVQIVRKRNPDPALDGNEIELDFEALDTETLWELDRFVGNCKKAMNKIRRQEAISAASAASAPPPPPVAPKADEKVPVAAGPPTVGETTLETAAAAKRSRRQDAAVGDEDVDIGDEMPSTHFPPVEIEKDNSSSSESSSSESSSSSSSSDSDSRSSSGSDSEGDEAQSPAVGLRPPLQRT